MIKICGFLNFSSDFFCWFGKKHYLCIRKNKSTGVWCNGNTADSGPAFPGSSPGTPTEVIAR